MTKLVKKINIHKVTPQKKRLINIRGCEYCDFKFNSYNLFLDHINSNHLESDFDPDFYVMSDDPNGPPLYVHCRCSPISIM